MKRYGNMLFDPTTDGGGVVAAENPPTVTYDKEEFESGDFKGFSFMAPQFGSIGAVVDQYGEAIALNVLNSALTARIRTKVKNSLPKDLKPMEVAAKQQEYLQKYPDGVIFTQADAEKWKPEVRELTPNQLFKKAKEAFALASTDPANAVKHINDGQQFLAEMGKALQS